MTTTTAKGAGYVSAGACVTLRPMLQRLHAPWRSRASRALAGLPRLAAPGEGEEMAREIYAAFGAEFGRELEAVRGLAVLLPPARGAELISAGRHVEELRDELIDLAELSVSGEVLKSIVTRLVASVQRWCDSVEEAFGWMRQDTVPTAPLRLLTGLNSQLGEASPAPAPS